MGPLWDPRQSLCFISFGVPKGREVLELSPRSRWGFTTFGLWGCGGLGPLGLRGSGIWVHLRSQGFLDS